MKRLASSATGKDPEEIMKATMEGRKSITKETGVRMEQAYGRYIVDVMKIKPELPVSGMGVRRAHDNLKTDFIRQVRNLVEEAAVEMRNHQRDSEAYARMFNEELLDEGGVSMDRFTKWVNESPQMARHAQSADTKLNLIELQKRYESQVAESKGTWDVDWNAMLKEQNDHWSDWESYSLRM